MPGERIWHMEIERLVALFDFTSSEPPMTALCLSLSIDAAALSALAGVCGVADVAFLELATEPGGAREGRPVLRGEILEIYVKGDQGDVLAFAAGQKIDMRHLFSPTDGLIEVRVVTIRSMALESSKGRERLGCAACDAVDLPFSGRAEIRVERGRAACAVVAAVVMPSSLRAGRLCFARAASNDLAMRATIPSGCGVAA